MPTTTTDSVAVAERAQRRQPSGEIHDGLRDVDAVAARELPYQHLPEARHRAGRQQNDHVAGRAGLRGGVEQVRARPDRIAAPGRAGS